jgi:Holliday junction resolvase
MSGGARHRQKGDRIEREIVERHEAIGVHAERYPLSGASRFRGSGHDVDIYAFGKNEAPLVVEVKGRKGGAGFVTLEKWLGEYDALFLRRDRADPLVVIPWRVWARLLEKTRTDETFSASRLSTAPTGAQPGSIEPNISDLKTEI